MSDTTNPFDLGPAANPIDNSQFEAALAAWYADRDRIVNEVFPRVDKAIATVEDWTNVINNLIGLIQQFMPLISALTGSAAAGATTALTEANNSCVGVQAALNYVKTNLPSIVANVPGALNQVQNLFKKP